MAEELTQEQIDALQTGAEGDIKGPDEKEGLKEENPPVMEQEDKSERDKSEREETSMEPGAEVEMQEEAVVVQPARFAPLQRGKETGKQSGIDLILDVSVEVAVELGRTMMYIKDILQLGSGSVIGLDKLAGEPVDLLINGKLVAKGEVIVIDENFGVRVTDIIDPTQRIQSLK